MDLYDNALWMLAAAISFREYERYDSDYVETIIPDLRACFRRDGIKYKKASKRFTWGNYAFDTGRNGNLHTIRYQGKRLGTIVSNSTDYYRVRCWFTFPDAPTRISSTKDIFWTVNEQSHRTNGPAIINKGEGDSTFFWRDEQLPVMWENDAAEACDTYTPPERLTTIVRTHSHWMVRAFAAHNPNCPEQVKTEWALLCGGGR